MRGVADDQSMSGVLYMAQRKTANASRGSLFNPASPEIKFQYRRRLRAIQILTPAFVFPDFLKDTIQRFPV